MVAGMSTKALRSAQPFEHEPRHLQRFFAVQEMAGAGYHPVAVLPAKILRLVDHQLAAKVVTAAQCERWNRDRPVHRLSHIVQARIPFF